MDTPTIQQPAQQPYTQPPAPVADKPRHLTVCGVVGVVFGALGTLLSFIPIVNNLAAIMGVIGVVLAVIGLVGTLRGRRTGKGVAIAAAVLSVLTIVITLAMQAATVKAIDDAFDDATTTQTQQPADGDASDAAKTESAGVQDMEGDLEHLHVKIVSAVRSGNDYEGHPTVLVTYEWTNDSDENGSFASLAVPQVFQNGVALDAAVYMDSPGGYDANSYMTTLQPGASGTVTLGYVLNDDSAVTVEVTDFLSWGDAKVSHTFDL